MFYDYVKRAAVCAGVCVVLAGEAVAQTAVPGKVEASLVENAFADFRETIVRAAWVEATGPGLIQPNPYTIRYRVKSPLNTWQPNDAGKSGPNAVRQLNDLCTSTGDGNAGLATSPCIVSVISDLTPGTAYEFQVRVANNVGLGPWSDLTDKTDQTTEGNPPTAPAVPTPTSVAATGSTVTINWNAPATGTVTEYRVRWRLSDTDSGMTGAQPGAWQGWAGDYSITDNDDGVGTGSTDTSYTIPGLATETAYQVSVAAVNEVSASAFEFTLDTVTGAVSTDANLSDLVISAGELNFAPATTSYSVTVPFATSTVTVTPTHNSAGIIRVNTFAVISGMASEEIMIAVGENEITIIVLAENGMNFETYTITVTRTSAADEDASLSALNISAGELNPPFAAEILTYTAAVRNAVAAVSVTPAATAAAATFAFGGGGGGDISLTAGENEIDIIVTAADTTTMQTYKINITRAAKFDMNVDNTGIGDITATDVILIARYLLGVRGDALINGHFAEGTITGNANSIATQIETGKASLELDVDANDTADGDDGIMIARYLFGIRDAAVTKGFPAADTATVTARILELLAPPETP